jgi:KilA-N domain
VFQGGNPEEQGTWIHPKLATRFAIWLSDEFGYAVECWVEEWMTTAIAPEPLSIMDMIIASAQAHKILEQRQLATEQLLKEAIAQKDEEIRRLKATVEVVDMESQANSAELERFRNGHGFYFSIAGWCSKHGAKLSLQDMNNLGRKATAMCKNLGIQPVPVNDPRWGQVNTYPDSVLMELV